ncbi:hypothetical protein [Sulfuriflexus mobilis]|uniref:hypothetical protein n=1 Tax=Sulfuriflexus mobilis TaxID=1811807 RepID=UPI000F843EAF|nr:hypothetical protein [Sulfuriflexus mobilis]
MTNNTKSQGATKPVNTPPGQEEFAEQAEKEALEKAKEVAEELTNIVAESVSPPGTKIPRRKK